MLREQGLITQVQAENGSETAFILAISKLDIVIYYKFGVGFPY